MAARKPAIFPGELPRDPDAVFSGDMGVIDPHAADYRFVRFRPPIAARDAAGAALPLPHIRLDRALQSCSATDLIKALHRSSDNPMRSK